MRVSTYRAFEAINDRLDRIELILETLVDQQGDRGKAKELKATVQNSAAALSEAIPQPGAES